MIFLDCPAYLNQDGTVRCGLPAEATCPYPMRSTDGPLEGVRISCPAGHHFNGTIESLSWNTKHNHDHDPGTAELGSRAGHDSLQRGHDGRDGGVESAMRDLPAGPERKARRPHGSPPYYLGRPAALWIAAMRPHRRSTAARCPTEAAVSGGNPNPGLRCAPEH
jgi:hypothetical protein